MPKSVKLYAGAVAIDAPRLLRCLATRNGWLRMRNRSDKLSAGPNGRGIRCDWEYSRALHLCGVFPRTGRWLLKRALQQWPINLEESAGTEGRTDPSLSFIIGHRGTDRLPQLRLTLASIRGQLGVDTECVVVEQDACSRIAHELPKWVRYHHAPLPEAGAGYSRAKAFNAGARLAKGKILVLHDNDIAVPQAYGAEICRLHDLGYEVCRLNRFIFYAGQQSTQRLLARNATAGESAVDAVLQNAVGGTTAISRRTFEAIGGMDEAFVGWGGEDNEFWSRCLTRRIWDYGYLPFLHLWHPSVGDRSPRNPALALWAEKRAIPAVERIRALRGAHESAGGANNAGETVRD